MKDTPIHLFATLFSFERFCFDYRQMKLWYKAIVLDEPQRVRRRYRLPMVPELHGCKTQISPQQQWLDEKKKLGRLLCISITELLTNERYIEFYLSKFVVIQGVGSSADEDFRCFTVFGYLQSTEFNHS